MRLAAIKQPSIVRCDGCERRAQWLAEMDHGTVHVCSECLQYVLAALQAKACRVRA
jgi:hypothetical protein